MLYDRNSIGNRIFDVFNWLVLFLLAFLCIFPFINVIAGSFTTVQEFMARQIIIIPRTFSLDAYRFILSTPTIFRALGVSVGVTVVGTAVSVLFTALMAYALSRKYLPGRRPLNFMVFFTMLFGGGMIPFFLVVQSLGLINSYWSLILPSAISAWNLIIMRNFFNALPESLEESAKLDGANDIVVFFRIVVPLSMASIATIALFYAVARWNGFFHALLFLHDHNMWPIQILLRQIVIVAAGIQGDVTAVDIIPPAQTVQMAVIVVATVPILLVYPFVQRHFVKGALIGSVKG